MTQWSWLLEWSEFVDNIEWLVEKEKLIIKEHYRNKFHIHYELKKYALSRSKKNVHPKLFFLDKYDFSSPSSFLMFSFFYEGYDVNLQYKEYIANWAQQIDDGKLNEWLMDNDDKLDKPNEINDISLTPTEVLTQKDSD
jgi:hypothetical protein